MFKTKRAVFLVKGSAEEPYKVTFELKRGNLTAYCTCPAGEKGMYCKHRFAILEGSSRAVVSENLEEVGEVAAWLKGTDLERAMAEVADAEAVVARSKRELTAAKKALAAAMRG
jgi:uncharacterized Zn finger protein